ncbi:alpha-amylase family glycosyl hydrolase [Ornithinibacillus californiensis]|uniref:alpha-amylase family glycosyl hydrolase n=1 Tax=Ornithinibacillus californiensis TaxID=161536 RepID=UPI00064DF1CD|nr:alpha-amylase family glycosyl hydrolase [Ornithinibacillus californiensis]
MRKILTAFITLILICNIIIPVHAEEKDTWEDEMIYFIMTDRFHNGDTSNDYQVDLNDPRAYHGGDFQGIIEKLDYIQEMGFTAIWLTPIVKNEPKGYHGYWTEDFYEVEEHFGTLEEFKTLVQEAHERDIKIILDLVVNHTGYQHPWLTDPDKQDWFHEDQTILDWDNQENVENGRLAGLPDLAQENPETRKYLLDMAKWWIEETDIDGYRLDTVKHVPKDFWEQFATEVKSVKEDFFLIGEVWHSDPTYVADYAKTGIDSFVDYPFFNEATRIFSNADQRIGRYMHGIWERNQTLYENPYILGNFIDNHDNKRFTRLVLENNEDPATRLKLALAYMYTAPGIPIVYYGTEIAMDGGEDPDNRHLMEFQDHEIISYISTLGEMRQENPALTKGDFVMLVDQIGTSVFSRTYEDEQLLIAINNTVEDQEVVLTDEELPTISKLVAKLGEESISKNEEGYVLHLPKESAEIYVVEEVEQDETTTDYTIWYAITIAGVVALLGIWFVIRKRKA